MLYSGQKVVCINAGKSPHSSKNAPTVLVEGSIYTVLSAKPAPPGYPGQAVRLVEVSEPKRPRGYASDRFRPLCDRKTDISSLERILHGAPVDHHEPEENTDAR